MPANTIPHASRAVRLADAMVRVQRRDETQQPVLLEPELVPMPTDLDAHVKRVARAAAEEALAAQQDAMPAVQAAPKRSFWPGVWLFVLGAVVASTALFTYAWLAAGPTG